MMTINEVYGPSQVALINENMSARYNGILVYETEPKDVPSPWQHADIGSVGFAGTADHSEQSFALTASGEDIWTTADSFGFAHQSWSGDVDITARVVHHGVTDWWQKAGVMVREDLTAGSRHAAVVLTGVDWVMGNATYASRVWRNAADGESGAADSTIATNNQPYWVRVKREDDTFTGYHSPNALTWTQIGTPVTITGMSSSAYVGLALTSHNNDRITDAVFDNVRVLAPIPSPWESVNIGSPTYEGMSGYHSASSMFEIDASGAGIAGLSDEFRFVYQPLDGNGDIVARIASIENTDPCAKAGVMIRRALTAGSSYHMISLDAGGNLQVSLRQSDDTGTGVHTVPGGPFTAPIWVCLKRADHVACQLEAYYSTDGINWNQISLPGGWNLNCFGPGTNAYAGLAVTANTNSDLCTAQIDNVTVYQCGLAGLPGDINYDCMTDLADLTIMAADWLYGSCCRADLAGYWALNDKTGAIAVDNVAGNNGTLVNFPTDDSQWASGKFGGALTFDGTEDYVSLPNIFNPSATPFTLSAWVRLDTKQGSVNQVIVQQEGSNGRTLLYRDAVTDKLGCYLGGVGNLSDTAVFATTDQWHHVCVTYDGTIKFYIDGAADGSSTAAAESETSGFRLGAHKTPTSSSEYWAGLIDDVRMYEKALSYEEIQYLSGAASDCSHDGITNLADFGLLADEWLNCGWLPTDVCP